MHNTSMLRNLNKKTSMQGGLAFLYYSSCPLQHFEQHRCRCTKQPSGLRINRCTNRNPGLITNRCTKQPSGLPSLLLLHVFGYISELYCSKQLTGLATIYHHGKSAHHAMTCSSRPILDGFLLRSCLTIQALSRFLPSHLEIQAFRRTCPFVGDDLDFRPGR